MPIDWRKDIDSGEAKSGRDVLLFARSLGVRDEPARVTIGRYIGARPHGTPSAVNGEPFNGWVSMESDDARFEGQAILVTPWLIVPLLWAPINLPYASAVSDLVKSSHS